MSKEFLLEQIALNAEAEAERIVKAAEESAELKKQKLGDELQAEYQKKLAKVDDEAQQIISGQKTLLRIDGRKAELKVKRELIDSVFGSVRDKIVSLSDEEYRKLMSAIVSKYAEDGDELVICRGDESRLTYKWLSDLAFDLQLSLSFADDRHDDVGGVILRGKKYDKNLTVSAIVNEARKSVESTVADRLFG